MRVARPLALLPVLLVSLISCRKSPAPSENFSAAPAPDEIRLLFSYGSEKQKWIEDVTAAFNQSGAKTASGKRIAVQAIPKGSGECIDDLTSGREHDDLISPASNIFIKLGNAQSRAATGKDMIGNTQNLVLSPVVIAMWKPMAEAIGWGKKPVGWSDILALARDKKGWSSYGYPQWGTFKFGHTHPAYSNSGILSLIAENYAAVGKVRGLTVAEVDNPKTRAFVNGIEASVVHYGSSTGFFGRKLFDSGPEYLSAAVLYESMVVESYRNAKAMPFPVVAIYPREGTFWSDHPIGIVDRNWVTPERREAAQIYINYLLANPQQQKALAYGFRPGSPEVPVGAPIDAEHGVDPKQPVTTLEVPSSEVINAIEQQWNAEEKKPADIALVLDTSGRMSEESKMPNAKAGATQLVSMLSDKDEFSLISFNNEASWATTDQPLAASRKPSQNAIDSLFPGGGTALYDAIDTAYQHLEQRPADHIRAIVVLTDGEDNKSALHLNELLPRIRADAETHTIRIYTIAYGSDARRDVLEQIATATQGKSYTGDPKNIVEVFRDISTFF
ncbi:MAG: VWA domain-containing protein [Silvibacterium sp.]|nr:VWA domain-containing protein [Silvibacterium sp.]